MDQDAAQLRRGPGRGQLRVRVHPPALVHRHGAAAPLRDHLSAEHPGGQVREPGGGPQPGRREGCYPGGTTPPDPPALLAGGTTPPDPPALLAGGTPPQTPPILGGSIPPDPPWEGPPAPPTPLGRGLRPPQTPLGRGLRPPQTPLGGTSPPALAVSHAEQACVAQHGGEQVDFRGQRRAVGAAPGQHARGHGGHVGRGVGGQAEDLPAGRPAVRRRVRGHRGRDRGEGGVGPVAPFGQPERGRVGEHLLRIGQVHLDQPGEELDARPVADGAPDQRRTGLVPGAGGARGGHQAGRHLPGPRRRPAAPRGRRVGRRGAGQRGPDVQERGDQAAGQDLLRLPPVGQHRDHAGPPSRRPARPPPTAGRSARPGGRAGWPAARTGPSRRRPAPAGWPRRPRPPRRAG